MPCTVAQGKASRVYCERSFVRLPNWDYGLDSAYYVNVCSFSLIRFRISDILFTVTYIYYNRRAISISTGRPCRTSTLTPVSESPASLYIDSRVPLVRIPISPFATWAETTSCAVERHAIIIQLQAKPAHHSQATQGRLKVILEDSSWVS